MKTKEIVGATPQVSSLHRFMPYRGNEIDAETIATGCVLLGMLCLVCLLFVHCVHAGVLA